MPGARAIGILANKPIEKLAKAEMAAVPVIRSRLTSCTHVAYKAVDGLSEFKQYGSSNPFKGAHIQVPPLSTNGKQLASFGN